MASLIDKMRSGTEKWETVQAHGFDPDMRTCGWAYIGAHYRTDVLGVFSIDYAVIGRLDATTKKKTGLDQASAMVDGLIQNWPFWNKTGRCVSFIESQQTYADPDMDRGELIAKANDLLRLAHIAGAFHSMVSHIGHEVHVLLPAQWKGQKPKPTMHEDIGPTIEAHSGTKGSIAKQVRNGAAIIQYEKIKDMAAFIAVAGNSHSMDALCLAYAGLLRIVRGEIKVKESQ